jgi:hypothetical protein
MEGASSLPAVPSCTSSVVKPSSMQDHGVALADVMTIAIAVTLVVAAGLMWLGPETRGRNSSEM